MNDSRSVRSVERVRNLPPELDHLFGRQRPPLEARLERLPCNTQMFG